MTFKAFMIGQSAYDFGPQSMPEEYTTDIEIATDDQLRSWLLTQFINAQEIDEQLEAGFSYYEQVLAEEQASGSSFSL